jgi:hypothetical protein
LITGEIVILVEIQIPPYIHKKIASRTRKSYNDVVREVTRSRKTGLTRIFIENCPKGWWLALALLREGAGTMYILRSVGIMDIPSKVLELSKESWKLEFESVIEEELKKWGLKE